MLQTNEYVLATVISLLRDGKVPAEKSRVLELYFNDLYKLLLRKLADFDCQVRVGEEETKKLRSLLEELIVVKIMIGGSTEVAESGAWKTQK
ncbi:MAG: hypothetical protein WCO79_02555 [bacterium]